MLLHSIPQKFLTEDPLPESLDSEGSCFDGIDNDFDKKVDNLPPNEIDIEKKVIDILSRKDSKND